MAKIVDDSTEALFDARPGHRATLQRPLSVYGRRVDVLLSTAATLSPFTLVKVFLAGEMREERKTGSDSLLKAMKASRSGARPATISTRHRVTELLKRYIRPEHLTFAVDKFLKDEVLLVNIRPPSLWGIFPLIDEDLTSAARLLEYFDSIFQCCATLKDEGNVGESVALFESVFGNPFTAWNQLNPNVDWMVTLALDTALMTVAQYGHLVAVEPVEAWSAVPPQAQSLIAPGRTPIGHWVAEVQLAAKQRNISGLARWLNANMNPTRLGQVTPDDLKKWSAGYKSISYSDMSAITDAFRLPSVSKKLHRRFFLAQALMFLCDWTRSSTKGAAPVWVDIQGLVRRRYDAIYHATQN